MNIKKVALMLLDERMTLELFRSVPSLQNSGASLNGYDETVKAHTEVQHKNHLCLRNGTMKKKNSQYAARRLRWRKLVNL
jgi:hypothetical protein